MDIVARSETAYSEEFPIKPHEPVVMEISVGGGSGVYSAGDSRGTTEVTGCAALARFGDAGHDTIQTVVLEHGPVESELFSEEESSVVSDARDSIGVMHINDAARTVSRAD
jgi:hypothetical protein